MRAGELEDLPAARRQFAHRLPHGHGDLLLQQLAIGRGGRARCQHRRVESRDHPLMPEQIEHPIARGLEEIGAERSLENYIRPAAPQLQHDLLRHVLRSGTIAEHGVREPHQIRIIGPEDVVESLLDSLPKLFEVLLVAHAGALGSRRVGFEYRGMLCDGCHTRMSQESQPDWEMLGRYLAGESEAGEVDAVRRWIAADPRRGDLLATLDL